jgi:hypothetical protein
MAKAFTTHEANQFSTRLSTESYGKEQELLIRKAVAKMDSVKTIKGP